MHVAMKKARFVLDDPSQTTINPARSIVFSYKIVDFHDMVFYNPRDLRPDSHFDFERPMSDCIIEIFTKCTESKFNS